MWKVRVTHAEFYEDSNEQTAFCLDFVVKTLQYITETIQKKVKNARFGPAVAKLSAAKHSFLQICLEKRWMEHKRWLNAL